MTGLTPRDTKVLAYLRATISDANCPTFDEIKGACGLASKSNVHAALESIERKGWIKRQRYALRSIELTDPYAAKPTAELRAMRDRIDSVLAGRA